MRPSAVAKVGEQVQLGLAALRREARRRCARAPRGRGRGSVRLVLRDERRERLEDGASIARDAEALVRRAELLGSRVDLDQTALELQRPLAGRLGAQLGADREHDVGGAQQLLERALVAGGSDGERMVGRDRALAHVRGRSRRAEPLGERLERRGRAGAQHAAAPPEHRALGRLEQPRRLREQRRIGGGQGDGRDVERARRRQIRLSLEHVDRDLEHDRARGRGARLPERLGDQVGHLVDAARHRMPLRERRQRLRLRGQLVQEAAVRADHVARHLRDDVDERDVARARLHQGARRDERAGPGRRQQHARPAPARAYPSAAKPAESSVRMPT